jgi:large subunit ribosomal protein L20
MGNRRETIMRLAKGFFGRRKNCFSLAIRAVEKGLQKAYIGRKLKKRVARREWITQISAGAREHNISYAKLVFGMRYAEIGVNRKILATLAQQAAPSHRASATPVHAPTPSLPVSCS